jgi:hypothetical protein
MLEEMSTLKSELILGLTTGSTGAVASFGSLGSIGSLASLMMASLMISDSDHKLDLLFRQEETEDR